MAAEPWRVRWNWQSGWMEALIPRKRSTQVIDYALCAVGPFQEAEAEAPLAEAEVAAEKKKKGKKAAEKDRQRNAKEAEKTKRSYV